MHIAHHPIFVALSIVVACLGSWTALDLFRRVRAHSGVWRGAWLAAAGSFEWQLPRRVLALRAGHEPKTEIVTTGDVAGQEGLSLRIANPDEVEQILFGDIAFLGEDWTCCKDKEHQEERDPDSHEEFLSVNGLGMSGAYSSRSGEN